MNELPIIENKCIINGSIIVAQLNIRHGGVNDDRDLFFPKIAKSQ